MELTFKEAGEPLKRVAAFKYDQLAWVSGPSLTLNDQLAPTFLRN